MAEVAQQSEKTSAFTLRFADNGIAWLEMDVPGEKMNTLQASFDEEVSEVLDALESRKDLKGLVIYSGKPDNFVAGADVRMLSACKTADEGETIARRGQELFARLEALPMHVVAAIHGPCLGGGLELALACHSRVVSDDDKTRLGLPEVQLGLLPGSGGTQRLPRLIGVANSLDMILTGKQLRASKAKKMGVADDCVPKSVLLDVAEELALKSKPKRKGGDWKEWAMAKNSLGRNFVFDQATKKTLEKTRGNYPAAEAILEVIKHGLENGMSKGLALEAKRFGELVQTNASDSLRSLFFAVTEMKKENGAEAEPRKVTGVNVLGGGLMGAGIAHVSATKAGLPVRVKDVSNDGALNALQYNFKLLDKKRKRRILTSSQVQQQMSQISAGISFQGMGRNNVVVEAVFEDLTLKRNMVADIEKELPEDTIFATNTSSLPIHQIAEGAKRPENIVGLHYFSPVEKMPLVEVIPHAGTSNETVATVVNLARKQGKTPIVVADKAGFYVNRILAPYMNESAMAMLEGEPVEHIDSSLVDFGFPVGPVTLLDEVGIDVGAKIGPILAAELGDRFKAPDVFSALIEDGRKGRKSGKGVYIYNGKKKTVDKEIYSILNISPQAKMDGKDLAIRCTLMMLNEAARCLDEGVVASARDGDIGSIFGIGFPPFLGGPFRYMDHLGIKKVVELLEQHTNKYGERFAPCEKLKSMAENGETFHG